MGFQTHSVSHKTLVIKNLKVYEECIEVCVCTCVCMTSLQYYEYSTKFITNPVSMLDYAEFPVI